MNIPEGIFKSYDIRGIYPRDLNEENVVPITKAIYKLFQEKTGKDRLSVVVGRDMRLSSPQLFKAMSETLVSLGAEVIEPGVVSTPTFYFTVFNKKYDAGIQITASHNPKEWAGMKMVVNTDRGLLKIGKSTGMDDIKRMSLAGEGAVEMEGGKIAQLESVLSEEFKNAMEIAGNPEIAEFKVAADAANAMGATYVEEVFKHIPGELIKMNFELDGSFPAHEANPMKFETLVELQNKIKEVGADLGIATDGDGDRIYFIDDQAEIVQPSSIIAIVVKELLKDKPGEKILVDLKYTFTPRKAVEEMGGELVIWKTGHAFITEKMQETGGLFAGEASGHYYFKACGGAEASMPVILMLLGAMTREGKKLSELVREVKAADESGEINFAVKNAKEIMDKMREEFSDGQFSDLDGIAISYDDWRFSLRSSNTEPLLRLNMEELEKSDDKDRKQMLVDLIEKYAEFEEEPAGH